MPDVSRLQVRKNDTENTWGDVGHQTENQKVPVSVYELLPVDGNNPSLVLGYVDNKLSTVTKTINSIQYQKTLTYTGSNLTGVSNWEVI